MEKIIRNFKVDYSLDWTYGIEISKLRADLNELEKLGATHVEIEPYNSYDSAYVDIDAYANRLETDEECKERLEAEKEKKSVLSTGS